jgi:hypothetical protein
MDVFMDSPDEGEDGGLFLNDLMAESQISNLELSSQILGRGRSYPAFTPPSSRPSSGRSHKPTPPRPSTVRRTVPPHARHREEASANEKNTTVHSLHGSSTSVDSWESDADIVERRHVPRHANESQQDLAERISHLSRTINANAAFCLELSSKMIEVARENKHLLDGTKSTLDAYVLQPALKLPGILKTYYPGIQDGFHDGLEVLREYEAQLRRTVQNCANGRDMARAQGVHGVGGASDGGERKREMNRLKDRLVEQDALLRDSSQHVQRLIREREALKKQLEQRKEIDRGSEQESDLLKIDATDDADAGYPQLHSGEDQIHSIGEEPNSEKDMAALADHLSEMRVLMDRLALHEVCCPKYQTTNKRRLMLQNRLRTTRGGDHQLRMINPKNLPQMMRILNGLCCNSII